MPLVRIDIRQNPDPTFARRIGEQVYAALRSCIDVPEHDNFQILNEHDGEHFVYDPQYLGIQRSDDVVFIQITISEGRSVEKKQLLFKTIAEGLHARLGIRLEDVFVNLLEVKKENWSFGNGVAQYVT
ncbi:4-oxalocrotonate tautomerase [Pseudomonas fluorescens]|jgi:phenylpyruvate tautomerase PptA (4-oxalocrotonate tautomerase family)|uniref:tautomerase family protein n=1 Tax=Pseudomonas fluorescens group TaxID=136843 RepID=UPI00058505B7|nr:MULTISPECIES: tautomerase family protein [Pseudomonas fluorescens group]KIF56493.1 4-oxalocrotonate tautomerase [Pseudomonas fluorescens]MDR7056937.1 phenylpyruvate tautomerase PptA (4-oxalocrotonate tautomerase family) [Pseudomonas koreensis]